jgi:hypothetical protein
MKSYSTIDEIVREFMMEAGETTLHKYQRYLSYALAEASHWHFDAAQEVKTVRLKMNDIKQAALPADYVDFVKVGIQCGDIIKTLHLNPHMVLANNEGDCGPIAFDDCDCSCNGLPSGFDSNAFGGYVYNNFGGETLYGYGSGYLSRMYFQIYKDKQAIQFSSDVMTTPVYMEYISTGFSPCSKSVINAYAKELIKGAIDFKRLWHAKDVRYRDAKQLLDELRLQARHRIFAISGAEIIAISRRNSHQATKG